MLAAGLADFGLHRLAPTGLRHREGPGWSSERTPRSAAQTGSLSVRTCGIRIFSDPLVRKPSQQAAVACSESCGTAAERDRVLVSTGLGRKALQVLVIQTAAEFDYVVTGAVGWREDDG
jgi:hypothetical protein